MNESTDDSQKTEEPTQKKIEDSIKEGQVPFSREVVSLALLLTFTITMLWAGNFTVKNIYLSLQGLMSKIHLIRVNEQTIIPLAKNILIDIFKNMTIPLLSLIICVYFASIIQNGIIFSTNSITPKLERISILSGFKKMFSLRSIAELLKGIIKIILIGIIFFGLFPKIALLKELHLYNSLQILQIIMKSSLKIMIGVCTALSCLAVIDLIFQRFMHYKSLRMSLQEIKDELKQTEGNPEIKAKIRKIRNQRASQRMMNSVPDSDVVITNPTHYSIALKYNQKTMTAPIITAKGKDFLALKIREIAKEHKIPIIESPSLARDLFNNVDVSREIPPEYYHAAAKIIRHLYNLKKKV